MANEWRYALVHGDEIIDLTRDEVVVGRSRVCDIRIAEASVSRKHFRLFLGDGDIVVQDLGSSNGSFVNDVQVHDRATLVHDDVLRAGDVALRVRIEQGWESDVVEPEAKVDTVLLEHDFLDSLTSSPQASGGESLAAETEPEDPPPAAPDSVDEPSRLDDHDEAEWPEPEVPTSETPGEHQLAAARAAAETPPAGTIWEIDTGESRLAGEEDEPAPPPMAGRLPSSLLKSVASAVPETEPAPVDELAVPPPPEAAPRADDAPALEIDARDLENEPSFDLEAGIEDADEDGEETFDFGTFDAADIESEVEVSFDALSIEEKDEPEPEPDPEPEPEPEPAPVFAAPVAEDAASARDDPGAPDDFATAFAAPAREPEPAVADTAPGVTDDAVDEPIAADRAPRPQVPTARPPVAGFGARLLAAVLEAIWIAVLWVGVVFFLDLGGDARALQLSAGAVLLVAAVIILVGWTLWGTSPGKRILGLYVCTADGRPAIGSLRAIVRMGGYLASLLTLGIGFLMAAGKTRRALHDRLAGTYVARWQGR